jgi:hypothetical protein
MKGRSGRSALVSPASASFKISRHLGPLGFVALKLWTASAATLYVDSNSANPQLPFSSWATAAGTIQNAVDAAQAGDMVLVTNGVYATGGHAAYGLMTNRVAITKPVTVASVNGAAYTVIAGSRGYTGGPTAIRCAYLTNGAVLAGFTLTNGATVVNGDLNREMSGGVVWCEGSNSTVSNCVVTQGWAAYNGGGAYSGTLINCLIRSNMANRGGGAAFAILNNCTVSRNASNSFKASPPGVYSCSVTNSIVYDNLGENHAYSSFSYSCTTPLPDTGTGNITVDPAFIDSPSGDLRLQSNSPCINAGNDAFIVSATDLDDNPRVANGTVDLGAYEYQGSSGLTGFHEWLAQQGLPSDGSADYADSDGDGMNNYQEWRTGTNPTDPLSFLKLLSFAYARTNVVVHWKSALGIGYFVERSTGLGPATIFMTLATNLPGQAGTTAFTDLNPPTVSDLFYRVGVRN